MVQQLVPSVENPKATITLTQFVDYRPERMELLKASGQPVTNVGCVFTIIFFLHYE